MNNEFRPPPPQGAPPSYAFVTRVYKQSLRPVIIVIATMSGIWSLLWATGSFRAAAADRGGHIIHYLQTISYVLGALYMAISVIEIFGVVAAVTRRITLVRTYAFLTIAAGLLAVAAGLIRTIVQFGHKKDLINECIQSAVNQTVVFRFGFWGPLYSDTLDQSEATDWCNNAWNRGAWSEIISLLFEILISIFFTSIAFSYYRQCLDPTSPANAARAPSAQARRNAWGPPEHYNPPYNTSVPNLSYNAPYASGPYAPPPGPPPMKDPDDDTKPPSYGFGTSGTDVRLKNGLEDDKDDPFADFDGPARLGHGGERK